MIMSLRLKLLLPFVFLVVCAAAFLYCVWLPDYLVYQEKNFKEQEKDYIELLSTTLLPDLLVGDLAKVYATLDDVLRNRDHWEKLFLLDPSGKILYPLGGNKFETLAELEWFDCPIRHEEMFAGTLRAGVDLEKHIREDIQRINALGYLLLALIFILSLLSILFQEIWIRIPLHKLAAAASKIAQGQYDAALPPPSTDEVGRFSRAFDDMRHMLQQREQERNQAENALRESEEKFRLIAETIQDVFWMSQPDMSRILYVSSAYEKVWGQTREALYASSEPFMAAIHPEDQQYAARELKRHEKDIWTLEYRILRPDGKVRWILNRGFPVYDNTGHLVRMVGVARDTTEHRLMEKQLMQSEKLASIGQLAAGVAHEINNPINGIINYAQILIDETDGQAGSTDIPRRIMKEGERVATIVKNLLTFARKNDDTFLYVSLMEIVSESLQLIGKHLENDGIQIQLDIPAGLPKVMVNYQKIQQVFINLLTNSHYALNQKYQGTHQDKILKIESFMKEIEGKSYVRIIFFDQGTGISQEDIPKICEPFFTKKPTGQGTGLGLSIVFGIIRDHNGNLEFESREGDYTKVIIDLPV
jgi:PAS domain S-box-containing protein